MPAPTKSPTPVQPRQPRAVGEVEARDRIERRLPALGAEQVIRAEPHDLVPERVRHGAQRRRAVERKPSRRAAPDINSRCAISHARNPGIGESVANFRISTELAAQILDDLLDQKVAERHAAQPGLAVGDRVEDRRSARARDRDGRAGSSSGCTLPRIPCVSAASMKISGSSGSAGWKNA